MTENAFTVHPYLIYAGISFFFVFLLGNAWPRYCASAFRSAKSTAG